MALFEIQDLNFSYPKSEYNALSRVGLSITEGSFVLLAGQSGCGKSTLLKHLKKVLTPHGERTGHVLFDGVEVSALDGRADAEGIGFVMQNIDNQIVTDKVYAELAFGLESLGCKNEIMRRRIAEMASFLGIHKWFRQDTSTLSGGQKQMLNLASVMVMQPRALILDEPTSQLDPIAAADFLDTIVRINHNLGTTVILTEHRLEEVFPYADTVVIMDGGHIVDRGTPHDVSGRLAYGKSRHVISSAFPSAVRLFAGARVESDCPLTVRDGRAWIKSYARTKPAPKVDTAAVSSKDTRGKNQSAESGLPPAVKIKEAFFRYGKSAPDVLRGLNLTVPQGEIYCVLGGNGTGKSTALSLIGGLQRPYRGSIEVFGKDVDAYKGGALYQNCLSALPQNPQSLFTNKSVRRELSDMTKDESKIERVIERMGIRDILEQHPYDLSGGEQQKAAFAKVLLAAPRLILLDEPTKGLDAYYKQSFGALLGELVRDGTTVLMATHDVEFAASYATKCCLFFDGEALGEGSPKEFFSGNYFYTTAANRIARAVNSTAVTVEGLLADCFFGEAAHV